MEKEERTDYRKATPETLYEARKTVIRMWKSNKKVEEIVSATDFSQDTVYVVSTASEKKLRKSRLIALNVI